MAAGANLDLFQPIIDNCDGCGRIVDNGQAKTCRTYLDPTAKWRLGQCNFATHIERNIAVQVKVNPLKASKRAGR